MSVSNCRRSLALSLIEPSSKDRTTGSCTLVRDLALSGDDGKEGFLPSPFGWDKDKCTEDSAALIALPATAPPPPLVLVSVLVMVPVLLYRSGNMRSYGCPDAWAPNWLLRIRILSNAVGRAVAPLGRPAAGAFISCDRRDSDNAQLIRVVG